MEKKINWKDELLRGKFLQKKRPCAKIGLLKTMEHELLDIYDPEGNFLGSKERNLVHKDGDWHNTVICLISYKNICGKHFLIFQRRSSKKDLYPNKIGITVGGHCSKGKTPSEILLRELNEELGIKNISFPINLLGIRQHKNISSDGNIDCEFQHLYHISCDIDELTKNWKINYEELSELIGIRLDDIFKLFSDESGEIEGYYIIPVETKTGEFIKTCFIKKSDLVPFSSQYYLELFNLILKALFV